MVRIPRIRSIDFQLASIRPSGGRRKFHLARIPRDSACARARARRMRAQLGNYRPAKSRVASSSEKGVKGPDDRRRRRPCIVYSLYAAVAGGVSRAPPLPQSRAKWIYAGYRIGARVSAGDTHGPTSFPRERVYNDCSTR